MNIKIIQLFCFAFLVLSPGTAIAQSAPNPTEIRLETCKTEHSLIVLPNLTTRFLTFRAKNPERTIFVTSRSDNYGFGVVEVYPNVISLYASPETMDVIERQAFADNCITVAVQFAIRGANSKAADLIGFSIAHQ